MILSFKILRKVYCYPCTLQVECFFSKGKKVLKLKNIAKIAKAAHHKLSGKSSLDVGTVCPVFSRLFPSFPVFSCRFPSLPSHPSAPSVLSVL